MYVKLFVCEHNRIVRENTFILHFLKKVYINKKSKDAISHILNLFLGGC